MTYNQSKYILDTLNGFVLQETNFPYIIMVVDDASTDGEQEVIKKFVFNQFDTTDTSFFYEEETDYAYITYAKHKINRYCHIVTMCLKENHYSQHKAKKTYLNQWLSQTKYEALCEGDDYWIDSQKLQKQIDLLESNPNISMTFHSARVEFSHDYDDKFRKLLYQDLEERIYSDVEIFDKWCIPTGSVVYRRTVEIVKDKRFIVGDNPLFLSCAKSGYVYCVSSTPMSVYRLVETGLVSKKFSWNKQINHFKAILEHFGGSKEMNECIRKKIVFVYCEAFISGRLKKQSWLVLYAMIKNDCNLFCQIVHRILNRFFKWYKV